MADIQGFHAVLTLDGVDITLLCDSVAVERTRGSLKKSTMDGFSDPAFLGGEDNGTLSITGTVDDVGHEGLETSWTKGGEQALNLAVGDGGTIDAGHYAGFVHLNRFSVNAAPDSVWAFTLEGDTTALTYVAPLP